MTDPERDQAVEQWLRQTPAAGVRSESACLDAETLAAWAEGLLHGPQRSSAEAHASGCARCQAMLAVMVRTMPGPPPRSASLLRKWLMMLSPALAAGAAVALWFAVDQKPLQSPSASLSQDLRVPGQVSERAGPTAPSPSGALAKDASGRALGGSFDRELPERDPTISERQAARTVADDFKKREERASTADAKVANTPLERARIVNERKDEASRIAGSAPPASPPTAAPPPRATPESLRAAADDRFAQARSRQAAAPAQQAGQNQSQSPNQNQPAPRQEAAEPVAARPAVAERPAEVSVSSSVAGRDAAKRSVAAPGGAGGALGFRTNVAAFDVVPPGASVRWRVAEGRTVQRSLDAGTTWSDQYRAEDGVVLTAGAAPTPTVCWLVGRGGAVVLTTDGRDWRRVKFPEPVDLTAVTSTDARTATVTTANGRQFLTTDGGRNWTPR